MFLHKIKSNYIDEKGDYFKPDDLIKVENELKAKKLIEGKVIYDNPIKTEQPKKEEPAKKEENCDCEEYPLYQGGSWYSLSNGEKVQGKQNAIEKEGELNG